MEPFTAGFLIGHPALVGLGLGLQQEDQMESDQGE